jgi:ubiquinone biosynthesis protein
VGRLSQERRDQIVDLLFALSRSDERGMTEVLLEWTGDAQVDESALAADVGELVFNYEHVPLQRIDMGRLLGEITAIIRDHQIVLPADLALLFKALITLEGLGRQLDPDFQLLEHIRPFLRQVLVERYSPRALVRRVENVVGPTVAALGGLPRDLVRLLRQARRGRLRIEFDLKRLDHFGHQIDRSTNRLTVGVVTAALIIGSSIVMTVRGGPELLGLPLFGLLGFLIASANSIWLVWSIWRSNRE